MKLLFISACPPNNRSGGQFFSMNAIRDLSKSFDIDLCYFAYPNHDCAVRQFVKAIEVFEPSLKNCFVKPLFHPLFTRRFSKQLLSYIRLIAGKYDVLYFDYTQTAIYSLYVDHPFKVIRCHDVMVQKFKRQHSPLLPLIKKNEGEVLKSAKYVFVPSQKDSELVENCYGIKAIFTNEYLSDYHIPDSLSENTGRQFIFFGLWSRRENLSGLLWFIKNVLPRIDKDVKLSVMGGGLSKENEKKYLVPHEIEYLGFVKDCYSQIVEKAAVIVPLFEGAGVKVKVLDAFTAGTPVIGTEAAFEGIPEIENLTFHAQSADDFVKAINNFTPLTVQLKQDAALKFRSIYDKNHLCDVLQGLVDADLTKAAVGDQSAH